MNDIEKVIKGLKVCTSCTCTDLCPYIENGYDGNCIKMLTEDALSVIKTYEPRLITKADFENADEYGWLPVWCEEKTSGAIYCNCILIGALQEKGIRYWTSKPTDEQRGSIPWKD